MSLTPASPGGATITGCARRVVMHTTEGVCFACGSKDRAAPERIPGARSLPASAALMLPLCGLCARRQIASLGRGWWWAAAAPFVGAGSAVGGVSALGANTVSAMIGALVIGTIASAVALVLAVRLRERASPIVVVGSDCGRPVVQVPLFSAPLSSPAIAHAKLSVTSAIVSWILGSFLAVFVTALAWLYGHPVLVLDNPRDEACRVNVGADAYALAPDERLSVRVAAGEHPCTIECGGETAFVTGAVRAGDVALLSTRDDVCYGSAAGGFVTSSSSRGHWLRIAEPGVWREECAR